MEEAIKVQELSQKIQSLYRLAGDPGSRETVEISNLDHLLDFEREFNQILSRKGDCFEENNVVLTQEKLFTCLDSMKRRRIRHVRILQANDCYLKEPDTTSYINRYRGRTIKEDGKEKKIVVIIESLNTYELCWRIYDVATCVAIEEDLFLHSLGLSNERGPVKFFYEAPTSITLASLLGRSGPELFDLFLLWSHSVYKAIMTLKKETSYIVETFISLKNFVIDEDGLCCRLDISALDWKDGASIQIPDRDDRWNLNYKILMEDIASDLNNTAFNDLFLPPVNDDVIERSIPPKSEELKGLFFSRFSYA